MLNSSHIFGHFAGESNLEILSGLSVIMFCEVVLLACDSSDGRMYWRIFTRLMLYPEDQYVVKMSSRVRRVKVHMRRPEMAKVVMKMF